MSQVARHVFRTRNNARVTEYLKELEIDCVSATDTVAVEDAIPAGAYDVRVSGRVVTVIVMSGGGATFKVGVHGGDVDAFGAGFAKTAGTVFSPADRTAEPAVYSVEKDIDLVADAGAWTSGTIRLCIAYRVMTAPAR